MPTDSITSLGLDSLGVARLCAQLRQQFGQEVPARVLFTLGAQSRTQKTFLPRISFSPGHAANGVRQELRRNRRGGMVPAALHGWTVFVVRWGISWALEGFRFLRLRTQQPFLEHVRA